MQTITVKFGGTSLASASQIEKAAAIIRSDPARRFVVASAPGKRTPDDTKVTDLLYRCYNEAEDGEDFTGTLTKIHDRFADIIRELGVDFDLDAEIAVIREHLETERPTATTWRAAASTSTARSSPPIWALPSSTRRR